MTARPGILGRMAHAPGWRHLFLCACAVCALALEPLRADAQGFANMGSDAEGFALPAPDPSFDFPRDHGAHPDFRIEWWYVTAILDGEDGADYGVQWTLFRSALSPETDPVQGWDSPQVWFAHAGLTSASRHFVGQTFARGGTGQAGVTAAPFHAWINDWSMEGQAPAGADALDRLRITASGAEFAYDLTLTAEGPLVFHGIGGYSVKSPRGQASYYYSQPHYTVSGTLDLPAGSVEVRGRAWLDREWSSQPLADSQTGWDWFSLHLDGGEKLMVYRLRDADGPDYTPATWIDAGGEAHAIAPDAIRLRERGWTRVAGRRVPTTWRIEWPDRGIDVTARPLNPEAWMETNVPYWEGPVRLSGSHGGRGYLEMTGYD